MFGLFGGSLEVEVEVVSLGEVVEVDVVELEHIVGGEPPDGRHSRPRHTSAEVNSQLLHAKPQPRPHAVAAPQAAAELVGRIAGIGYFLKIGPVEDEGPKFQNGQI